MTLDRDDKRALAQLAGYLALLGAGLAVLLLLAITLALCVRLFMLVSGLGGI
jgi:hypothetical protein